jgi:hypothetical protein
MHEIKRLIAAERRDALRYTVKLILAPHHRLAARWRGLRAYHQAQIAKWRAKL